MHIEARNFTIFVKKIFPEYFFNKKILDVGGGDINGNNRFLFENCEYECNDVIDAPNITIVSKTKDLNFEDETFDTIISTECFEHDPEYKQSFSKIYNILKPNGLFLFTCASFKRPEHGTRRTSANDSYGTIGKLEDMQDYYKNLLLDDIDYIQDLDLIFSYWKSYYNFSSKDLYFFGIKKSNKYLDKDYIKYLDSFNYDENEPNIIKLNKINKNLDEVFMKYNTDKNIYYHNYSRQYDKLLSEYRYKEIKYLEIGVFQGESLKCMREVFKNANCIVGIDINKGCKQYENIDQKIFVEIGNATDETFLNNIIEKYGKFDVILDDGSHINKDVFKTFEILFPLLNDNGLYIVEDTVCYNIDNFYDKNYENHLEYFFKFTKYLNQSRFNSYYGIKDYCVDPFKILKNTNNIFEYSIDKIEYGCSYIAITKKIRKHWI